MPSASASANTGVSALRFASVELTEYGDRKEDERKSRGIAPELAQIGKFRVFAGVPLGDSQGGGWGGNLHLRAYGSPSAGGGG